MLTLQPNLKNGRNIWNKDAMPREEFDERVAALRQVMAARGLDLVLIYGQAYNGKADPCYFTNFVIRLPKGLLLAVPRQGEPALIFEGATRGLPSLRQTTWVHDLRGNMDMTPLIPKYLKDSGFAGGKVGLVGARGLMPFDQYRALREALGTATVVDVDDLVVNLRQRKSMRELDCIRRAGRVVAAMFDWLAKGPFVSLSEQHIEAGARRVARMMGAEDVRLLFVRPNHTDWILRPAADHVVGKGTQLVVYAAAELDRYWAEASRTFVMGNEALAPVEAEKVATVYQKMVQAVVPGQGGEAPVKAARSAAAATGIVLKEDYGFGNGIGLSLDEAPVIAAGSTAPLTAGMALSLRLATPAEGGQMIGDTLLVGVAGSEIVTRN
jgi:Xaa-Pro aminopeptidase